MKTVFSVLALLVALVVVALMAKQQLHAVGSNALAGGPPPGVASTATPASTTVPQRINQLEQKVRDDTSRALQQGMDRNERAEQAAPAER